MSIYDISSKSHCILIFSIRLHAFSFERFAITRELIFSLINVKDIALDAPPAPIIKTFFPLRVVYS